MIPDRLPLISISIPVYNEQENIDSLYKRLSQVADKMRDRCNIEFVFSDNCSTDKTWAMISSLAEQDKRIRAIRFSKNFGFQRSIMANYLQTRGDAVMQVDADLQDPPELLEKFFDLWQRGNKVVYGIRQIRKESKLSNFLRKVAYRFINFMSDHDIPPDAGDFRLIDRQVIEALKSYKNHEPYIRGLIAGMGFKQIGVPYERSARVAGESKFKFFALIKFTLMAILNHSSVPLRFATIGGVTILGISFLGSIYYLLLKIFNPDLPQGLASLHILVLFGIGFNSLLLGVIGEYIFRIYKILRSEPVAIVEESINISNPSCGGSQE